MSERTAIEWADSTANSWTGCDNVSPACDNCYAEHLMDTRLHVVKWGAKEPRHQFKEHLRRRPFAWNRKAFLECQVCAWRGEHPTNTNRSAALCPSCNGMSLRPTRRRVFHESLGDWLDNKVPIAWLAELLDTVRQCENLDHLLLTKRIGNWRPRLEEAARFAAQSGQQDLTQWICEWLVGNAPAHAWVGITVINQPELERDARKVLAVPARIRFLSIEPMLAPMDVFSAITGELLHTSGDEYNPGRIDWIIAGGEDGPRPSHPEWYRSLRDQCAAAGVAFMFKQWGAWAPISEIPNSDDYHSNSYQMEREPRKPRRAFWDKAPEFESKKKRIGVDTTVLQLDGTRVDNAHLVPNAFGPGAMTCMRIGKRRSGRLLDGREHNGVPTSVDG